MLDDLKQFGVPVVLFSGGEPLMRPDLFDLVSRTVALGMRAVISTNGTLISQEIALRLKDLGLSYVGISLDGVEATHDRFRGKQGAFAAAMAGVRRCQEVGLKVGLRFTLNQANFREVPAIFDLVDEIQHPPHLLLPPGLHRAGQRDVGPGLEPRRDQGDRGPHLPAHPRPL